MPSQRFMRLPQEKQTVIWEAAVHEFVDQPYEKVSINQIIKQAGISRGSFYTYFEDKRDLLLFILWGTKQQWDQFCVRSLKESGGEFFGIVNSFMEEAVDFCRHNNLFSLHKNLIAYPEPLPLSEFLPNPADCEQELNEVLLSKLDRSRFADPSDDGVAIVARIAAMILFAALSEFCRNPEREEPVKENFRRSLDVLKRGAYRVSESERMEDRNYE